MLNDGSLQLEHAEAENAGSYYCNATNVAGSRVHLIDLRVFRKFRYSVSLPLCFITLKPFFTFAKSFAQLNKSGDSFCHLYASTATVSERRRQR